MSGLGPIWILIGCAVVWSMLGLLAAVWFRRRGHNFMLFAGLAVWMGPLIVLLMRSVATDQERPIRVVRPGAPSEGWIDVLVGIDGSAASAASAGAAVHTIAPAIRRLRLVTVLDPETAGNPGAFSTDDVLEERLAEMATSLGFEDAELAFVSGRADLALVEHAEHEDFEILIVAHRNRGVMSAILGSTVERLTKGASVSVLIGPPAPGARSHQQPQTTRSTKERTP